MKKSIIFVLLILLVSITFGCQSEKYTLLVPSGVPLISVGGVVDEFDTFVTDGADMLKTELLRGEYDAIIAPVNLGVGLYNKGGIQYKLASVVTTDNVFIVSRKENKLDSLDDLNGKTIYSYSEGSPADKLLHLVIEEKGINAEIVSNGIASVSTLIQSYFVNKTADYILCAEPFVSNIITKMGIELNILDIASIAHTDLELPVVPLACLYLNVNNDDAKNKAIIKKIKANIEGIDDGYVDILLAKDKSLYPLFTSLGKDILTSSMSRLKFEYLDVNSIKDDLKKYLKAINLNLKDDGLLYE